MRRCSRGRGRSSRAWPILGRPPGGEGDPGRGLRGLGPRCGDDGPRPGGPRDHQVRPARAPGLRRRGVPRPGGGRSLVRGSGGPFPRRVRGARGCGGALLADALDLVVVRGTRCSEPARSDAGRCRPSSASGRTMRQRSATRRATTTCSSSRTRTPPRRSCDLRQRSGDRTRGGAREEPTDPRGATVGRRRVPLSVDGARARGDRRADRRDRVLAAAAPDRGERDGDARHRRRGAPTGPEDTWSPPSGGSRACVLADAGATSFLEAGPGDVLVKLMKRIVPHAAARAIGSPEDARAAASGTAAGS